MKASAGAVYFLSVFLISALCVVSVASAADFRDYTDNLFVDIAGGYEKPVGEDSTAFGSVGFNWGIPLTPDAYYYYDLAVGLQVGGDIKLREDDPEWDGTAGLFIRNLESYGNQTAAVAVLIDYRRTSFDNDLVALRPIIGTTISDYGAIGATGAAGLSRDSHSGVRQEIIDRAEVFWQQNWTDALATEVTAGYQFSSVDEALFGGQVAYGVGRFVDVSVGGEVNTAGNYAVGVSMSYHFGGTGRHPTMHNIGATAPGTPRAAFFTPFPKRSFPALLHRTVFESPDSVPGGDGCVPPPDGGGCI